MSQSNQVRLRNQTRKQFKRQLPLHLFVWAGILFLVLFSIIPMSGVIIAFKDYNIKAGFKGMFTAPWTANSGFKHFITFVTNRKFSVLVRNTVIISSLKLLFAFPFAILFAIMVTEVRSNAYKRIVQTASYLPHFVSWIVVAGIVYAMFSTNIGVINELLLKLGWIKEPIPLLLEAKYYYLLATASEIWKETGWSAIIYLAAIAGIDPALAESARLDGAGEITIFLRIIMPLSKPLLATLGLFAAVSQWNAWSDTAFFAPSNPGLRSLAFLMRGVIVQNQVDTSSRVAMMKAAQYSATTATSIQMAAMIIAVLPIMCVYPFLQKHFVKGIMLGAVKG